MDLVLAKRLATLNFEALREYASTELEDIKKQLLEDQPEISTAKLRGQARAAKELLKLGDLVDRTLKDFSSKA